MLFVKVFELENVRGFALMSPSASIKVTNELFDELTRFNRTDVACRADDAARAAVGVSNPRATTTKASFPVSSPPHFAHSSRDIMTYSRAGAKTQRPILKTIAFQRGACQSGRQSLPARSKECLVTEVDDDSPPSKFLARTW